MVAAVLPVKRGLSSPAVTSIPEKWDRQWFRYFIDNFLTNADIRNVQGTGITVSGNVSGNSTTGTPNTSVTITLAPIAPNSVLGNITGATAPPTAINQTQLTALINIFTNSISGAVPGSGGGTVNFLRADGTWANPITLAAANPTAKVGPTVVNGSAVTYMRSDAAPPIDLTANYSWTGTHTFNPPIAVASGGSGTSTPSLINGTGISVTGSWPNQTITSTVVVPTAANPTASVGLTAVNGAAATFMRSDAAPALSIAINPVWSGNHIHTPSSGVAVTINGTTGNTPILVNGQTGGAGFANFVVNGNASTTMDLQNSNTGASANAYIRIQNSADAAAYGISSTTTTTPFFTNGPGSEHVFLGTLANIPISIGTNTSERVRITAAGNVAINSPASGNALAVTGNSVLTGTVNVTAQLYTYTGGVAGGSGVTVTLQALPSTTGFSVYLVSAALSNVNDAANYSASSLVSVNGNNAKIIALQTAGLLTITLSGLNVQATQSSGAGQTISFSILRIA